MCCAPGYLQSRSACLREKRYLMVSTNNGKHWPYKEMIHMLLNQLSRAVFADHFLRADTQVCVGAVHAHVTCLNDVT